MPTNQEPGKLLRVARLLPWLFGAAALAYLFSVHRAHVFVWWPYLVILACPLMHLVMHRGHHHGHRDGSKHDHGSRDDPA